MCVVFFSACGFQRASKLHRREILYKYAVLSAVFGAPLIGSGAAFFFFLRPDFHLPHFATLALLRLHLTAETCRGAPSAAAAELRRRQILHSPLGAQRRRSFKRAKARPPERPFMRCCRKPPERRLLNEILTRAARRVAPIFVIVNLCSTAGQRWSQSPPPGHPAPLHRLARLRGALLAHRHAEIPQEGQVRQPSLRRAHCCALQVRILWNLLKVSGFSGAAGGALFP